MKTWTAQQARELTAPEEVQVVTRRPDGSLRRGRTTWIVGDGADVFLRSTNGRDADWFRHAIATGTGQVLAGGLTHEVLFVEADPEGVDRADAGYRAEYGGYASIVDHLQSPGPRAATLQVLPA